MAIPTEAEIGYPVRTHWATETGPNRPLANINTFVVHDTEGFFANDEPYLAAPTPPVASCHALIAPTGELVYMVPLGLTAWTPGNDTVAERSINVEMSGFQSKGYTEDQYKSMAAFFRWCVAQGCPIPPLYAGKAGTAGIIGHQDVPDPDNPGQFGGVSHHTDPGPLFSWNKFVSLCKGSSGYDPCLDYYNMHGGEAVFGKPIGGQYGTSGSIERDFEFAHLYLDQLTKMVVAQMKDRTNPLGLKVGPGIYGKCQELGLRLVVSEQWFSPDPGQPGLGKMSRAWAQDSTGVTLVLMASEQPELKKPGSDTPWKIEVLRVI